MTTKLCNACDGMGNIFDSDGMFLGPCKVCVERPSTDALKEPNPQNRTPHQQAKKMAERCDELAEILETQDWPDEARSMMFEIAAFLNCYAYELHLRSDGDERRRLWT